MSSFVMVDQQQMPFLPDQERARPGEQMELVDDDQSTTNQHISVAGFMREEQQEQENDLE